MPQFCESCGAPLKEGDRFCEQCGAAVSAPPAVAQAPGAPAAAGQPQKNPVLALVLSFFFPGLGQMYNGETLKGIALYLGTLVGLMIFLVPGIIVWIYGLYDAYTTAKKMNEGAVPYREANTLIMVVFVALILVIGGIVVFMGLMQL